jgi:hypothetical protein
MKLVFSSPNSALVGLAHSLLESANIASEIRNESVSQAMPGLPFTPELWVLHHQDFEEARSLVSSSLSAK